MEGLIGNSPEYKTKRGRKLNHDKFHEMLSLLKEKDFETNKNSSFK